MILLYSILICDENVIISACLPSFDAPYWIPQAEGIEVSQRRNIINMRELLNIHWMKTDYFIINGNKKQLTSQFNMMQ